MRNKARIAVFVSGGGTNLQALIDAQKSGILHSGELCLVVSSKPSVYALTRAEQAGIDTAVCDRKALGDKFEEELSRHLAKHRIDFIVLAGFMSILSADFTRKWDRKIINVHPALIPSFCGKGMYGLKPHIAALEKGVKVTGATVHFVNEIPDGGEIVLQKAVYVQENDTPETLQQRVMEEAEWQILPLACEKVAADTLQQLGKGE